MVFKTLGGPYILLSWRATVSLISLDSIKTSMVCLYVLYIVIATIFISLYLPFYLLSLKLSVRLSFLRYLKLRVLVPFRDIINVPNLVMVNEFYFRPLTMLKLVFFLKKCKFQIRTLNLSRRKYSFLYFNALS